MNQTISKIDDDVYICDWKSSFDVHELKRLGINTVICLTLDKKPSDILILYEQHNIKQYQIEIEDLPTSNFGLILPILDEIFLKSQGSFLFHCWAGISRSASAAIYYKCWGDKTKISPLQKLDKWHRYIKEKREIIYPREEFLRDIIQYLEIT